MEAAADDDGDGYDEVDVGCDDGDASIAPCPPDVGDGRDNDRDDAVDENPGPDDLAPVDGDGWGDPRDAHLTCDAPSQHVERVGERDDGDPEAHPEAEERCGDGVDQDCAGPTAGCGEAGD